jgi:hypothetical protein
MKGAAESRGFDMSLSGICFVLRASSPPQPGAGGCEGSDRFPLEARCAFSFFPVSFTRPSE